MVYEDYKRNLEKTKKFPLYNLLLAYVIYKRTAQALNRDENQKLPNPLGVLEAYQRKDTKELSQILQEVKEIKREDELKKVALEAFCELASYIGASPRNLKEVEEEIVKYIASKIENVCKEKGCIKGLEEILRQIKENEEEKSILEWLDRSEIPYKVVGRRKASEEYTEKRFFGLIKRRKKETRTYVRFIVDYFFNIIHKDKITSQARKALEILCSLGVLARIEGTDSYILPRGLCEVEEAELVAQDPRRKEIRKGNYKRTNPIQKAINQLYEELVMPSYREHQQP